jgi:hypothetical protein
MLHSEVLALWLACSCTVCHASTAAAFYDSEHTVLPLPPPRPRTPVPPPRTCPPGPAATAAAPPSARAFVRTGCPPHTSSCPSLCTRETRTSPSLPCPASTGALGVEWCPKLQPKPHQHAATSPFHPCLASTGACMWHQQRCGWKPTTQQEACLFSHVHTAQSCNHSPSKNMLLLLLLLVCPQAGVWQECGGPCCRGPQPGCQSGGHLP